MVPYATFTYFGILLYPVIPTVILGLLGRVSWRWILTITLLMLAIQYSGMVGIVPQAAVNDLWLLGAYAVFEYAVAGGFLLLRRRSAPKFVYYAALLLALSPLVAAKFIPLISPNSLFGFLGISYVTFRALDIIFNIQDKLITSLPFGTYIAYVFFFATISSGPIDRYRRFLKDWTHRRTRAEFISDLDTAAHLLIMGFLYKFVLGAVIKQYWLDPVTSGTDLVSNISYMYAYSFYLFFDFAGYSLFAIGISYIFGIHVPHNFNRPFIAANISDFWNRWHITLSTWFRDHVYMRFMLASNKNHWFSNKYLASYLGFFLTFGLMGLWHGPVINYIIYGLYHGTLLSSHQWFERWNQTHKLWGSSLPWRIAGIVITFNLVCFGFLIFSGHIVPGEQTVAAATPQYDGTLEAVTCNGIRGWAWASDQPNSPVLVNLYDGDTVVANSISADQPRPDLPLTGNHNHGFSLPLPQTLKDNQPHTLSARIAGGTTTLKNSSQTITCAP